jgi:hypothetical protein
MVYLSSINAPLAAASLTASPETKLKTCPSVAPPAEAAAVIDPATNEKFTDKVDPAAEASVPPVTGQKSSRPIQLLHRERDQPPSVAGSRVSYLYAPDALVLAQHDAVAIRVRTQDRRDEFQTSLRGNLDRSCVGFF